MENILTRKFFLGLEQLTNKPLGLDDGDDNDSLDDLNCSIGQIAIKGTNGWECKEFSSVLDSDGDGALQWNDCDDANADVGEQSNDNDCDGVITSDDCDDSDANNTAPSPIGSNEVVPPDLVRRFWIMEFLQEMAIIGLIQVVLQHLRFFVI